MEMGHETTADTNGTRSILWLCKSERWELSKSLHQTPFITSAKQLYRLKCQWMELSDWLALLSFIIYCLIIHKKCADIKMATSAELRATLILCKNVWQCAVYPASIQNKREKADTTWNALAEQKQTDPFIIHLSASELASQSKRSNLQKASKIVVYRYRSGWCC